MEHDLTWQVGQRLMTGFSGTRVPEDLKRLIREEKVGNIILFEENIVDRDQLRCLCAELQRLVKEATGLPALIAIDQEGGVVSRLKGDCAVAPSAMAVAATGDPENAFIAGEITGRELSALGVNFDLAPVMDVNSNPHNPVIGARSYGDTTDTVSAYGTAMIRGLEAGGVLSCAKHFPGHGDTAVDSHLGLPRVDKSLAALEACELKPFRAAAEAGVSAVMTTHILFPQLEEDGVPATMSRRIITGVLRERLGYDGLVVSDCMMMGAIQQFYGTVPGCVAALGAGVDMVIVSHSTEIAAQACAAIREHAARDAAYAAEMASSLRRILAAKERLAHMPAGDFGRVGGQAHRQAMRRLREQSVTLVGPASLPPLGDKPLFLGCYPFRPTLASSPVDRRVSFPDRLRALLGGDSLVTGIDPDEEEIRAAVAAAPGHSCLVLGAYNGHVKQGQLRLMAALAALGIPMVCVALRNPYDLAKLPRGVCGLAVYEYSEESLAVTAEVLAGRLAPAGRLSVCLSDAR